MHIRIQSIAKRIRSMSALSFDAYFTYFIASKHIKNLSSYSQFVSIITINTLGGERFGGR